MSVNSITSNPQLMEQISAIVQQSLPPAASSLSVVHYETGTPTTSTNDAVPIFILGIPTIVPGKATYVMVSFSFVTGPGTESISVSLTDGFGTLGSYSITGLPNQRVTQSYVFQFTGTTGSSESLSLGLNQTSGSMSVSSSNDYWMVCVLQQS